MSDAKSAAIVIYNVDADLDIPCYAVEDSTDKLADDHQPKFPMDDDIMDDDVLLAHQLLDQPIGGKVADHTRHIVGVNLDVQMGAKPVKDPLT